MSEDATDRPRENTGECRAETGIQRKMEVRQHCNAREVGTGLERVEGIQVRDIGVVKKETRSGRLLLFVLGVGIAGIAALATLPTASLREELAAGFFLIALTFVAGIRPVHIPSLRLEMMPTHPLILIALALVGPIVAALAGVGGVFGAAWGRQSRPAAIRLAFNVGAALLSVSAASWAFLVAGGRPAADFVTLLWPLAGAMLTFFLVNSFLVSAAIALEKRQSLGRTWRRTFNWTAPAYFAGLTMAVLTLLAIRLFGPLGVILSLPPLWLLISFYREHKKRLEESGRKCEEVEALNTKLDHAVRELSDAMEHVQQLQGLLPICMHCKSIRDDENIWHHLEEYLTRHSEARFTHALCDKCREKHYQKTTAVS
jgi:hypothetical protein